MASCDTQGESILQVTKPGTVTGEKVSNSWAATPLQAQPGFSSATLPIPKTTWPNPALLGRADKIAAGGGVATGQVT